MPSLPLLKALGLNFSPNQLEVAPGSLVEASNVIIRRDNVIESRRGYALYGTEMGTSTDRCKQLMTYKNKLIRHFANRLQYENGLNNAGVTSFFDFNEIVNGSSQQAAITEAETGLRIKSIEANSNLYLTTSEGIKKISSKSSETFPAAIITKAGGVKALDAEAFLNTTLGDQASFLPSDSGVAYKVVWGTKDASNNLILGTPSDPITILNPLLDLIFKDFSNLLLQIDNSTNTGNSLLKSTDYFTSLALPLSATSVELRDRLILLANKLDTDLLFATSTGAGVLYDQLQISGATCSSGVVSVNFTIPLGGVNPSDYFFAGDLINIPLNPSGPINGFTSGGVGIDAINTNQIITAVGATSVSFVAKGYTTSNPAGISGTITDIPAGSTSITLTAPNHGLKSSQNIQISGTVGINGTYPVTVLTPDTFSIPVTGSVTAENKGIWDIVIDGFSTAKIESYTFRDIVVPEEQSIPATNRELISVQSYFSDILLTLQDFIAARGSFILDSTVYTDFIEPLDTTSSSSVTLKITVPPSVLEYTASSNPYFYQVYRTQIAVVDGVSSISDISIIQEYTQIEEQFPTAGELSSGVIVFNDNTPESIAGTGANLYTNERSGEGGLQANDVPPFALDVNLFNGYTFFSNTRTRQRKIITLLGVVSMIDSFNPLDPYKITIANKNSHTTYSFVTGVKEITDLTCGAASILAASGQSDYFLLNSANDETEYYVWYQVSTSADPALTVPSLSDKTGIKVVLQSSDTANDVALKTATAISNVLSDFSASVVSNVVTITNSDVGESTDASFPSTPPTGFSLSTTQQGIGENVSNKQILLSPNPSVGIAIEETAKSLIRVINQNPNEFVNAFYVSGTDTSPGTILLEGRDLSSDEFYITTSNSTIGESFNPELSPGSITITSISVANPTVISTLNNNFLPTAVDTLTDIITINNHGFSENSEIVFTSSGTVPSPLVSGTKYYVKNSTLNAFQVSLVAGGAVIDLTTSGTGSLNVAVPHNLLNGDSIIISNSDSVPSIDGIYEITYVSSNQFTIPVNVTTLGNSAVFETTGVAEGSSNEEQPHRVYYSKFQQPESVPISNYLDIGATDRKILRIFPLRDSLFVFKEDGLFRISGEVAPFSVALFDSSCILVAPDSIAVANNQIYGWTTQGISTITEAGVNIISRPIDTEILRKASSQFINFKTATWGVGYESDNSYTVYTTNEPSDDKATIGFRFSNLTNSWTTVDKTVTCGLLNFIDDKLYLGAGDTNYIEKERKDFTRYDYADRELAFTISSGAVNSSVISLPTVSGLLAGDVVVQTQTVTTYEFNQLLKKLDLDPGVPSSDYFSSLELIAGENARLKLVALASKLDADLSTSGYSTDIASVSGVSVVDASIANPTKITTASPHGLKTGRIVTIAGNSEANINGTFQVTVLSPTEFTIPVDLLILGTGGSLVTVDNDFTDLKVCYNLIVSRLNLDTVVTFSNYRTIDNDTIQEAVIDSVNVNDKELTLNLALDYLAGPISIFKAIPCSFTYTPITMGDPLGIKHLREATVMFANKAFTRAEVDFSTDLLPELIPIVFNGDGNGIFGHSGFGGGFFGGGSNSAPFRTFIPRQCQRCRYINMGFSHTVAREQFAIYGITITGEVGQSTRAYR